MFDYSKSNSSGKRKATASLRLIEVFVLVSAVILSGYALVIGVSPNVEASPDNESNAAAALQDKDYSRFVHSNEFHSRLPCLLCHRRDDNSPRMRFPGKSDHLPCAGCHAAQFADNSSPICTICHTNAETGAMKGFPSLRSFSAKFNHSKHGRVNCAICHKTSGRGGAALSIPSRSSAHSTCFQCHSNRASFAMSSCSTCHQPGRVSRTSEWSVAFRKSFNHAKHLAKDMKCATCHTVRAGTARGRQVSVPLVSMHFARDNSLSCGGCHDGKKAFGPDDFANCKRCHNPKTFKF